MTKTITKETCFCCGRKIAAPWAAYTADGAEKLVGKECHKLIKAAGPAGFATAGNPALFVSRQQVGAA